MAAAADRPGAARPTRRAVTDWTISRLYDEIFAGRLGGGDALGEIELSERLGVSRSPVREALRELERDGVVSSDSVSGRRVVAGFEADDIDELYTIRLALERLSAERAASRITPDELAELRGTIAIMEKVSLNAREGRGRHFEADFAFHATICRAARTHRLEALLQPLWRQTRSLLRQIDMAHIYPRGREMGDAREDHTRVLEALGRGDSVAAGEAMAKHLAARRDVLVAAVVAHKREDGG